MTILLLLYVLCGYPLSLSLSLSQSLQTLHGHTQNISSVCYHPYLPIIISSSEDGSVRLWNSTSYHHETTLNYTLGRTWSIACANDSNKIALGYDEGTIVLNLGLNNASDIESVDCQTEVTTLNTQQYSHTTASSTLPIQRFNNTNNHSTNNYNTNNYNSNSTNKSQSRYHDDLDTRLPLLPNNNSNTTMLIELESKVIHLEMILHDIINQFFIISTADIIIKHKRIFDNEKLKLIYWKSKLSSAVALKDMNMNIDIENDLFVCTTNFAEWNQIADECNQLIYQLHPNASSNTKNVMTSLVPVLPNKRLVKVIMLRRITI